MSVNPILVDYGTDLSCALVDTSLLYPDGNTRDEALFDAPTDAFPMTSGRALLLEALCRRIVTPRGTLVDDPDYGTNVLRWLLSNIDARDASRIGDEIDAEFRKDERVIDSRSVVTFLRGVLSVTTRVVDGAGPFRLTLSLTSGAGLRLLGVQ